MRKNIQLSDELQIIVFRKYAPKCCACDRPIAPKEGETTAQRLTAFDKDWHPDCFKCEVRT